MCIENFSFAILCVRVCAYACAMVNGCSSMAFLYCTDVKIVQTFTVYRNKIKIPPQRWKIYIYCSAKWAVKSKLSSLSSSLLMAVSYYYRCRSRSSSLYVCWISFLSAHGLLNYANTQSRKKRTHFDDKRQKKQEKELFHTGKLG